MPPNLDRSVDRDEGKGHDNKTFHLSDENLATRKSYDMAVEGFSNSSSSIPDSDKKSKKKKKKGKDGEEKKPDGPPPVPFHQLFRFASGTDMVLLFLSVLAAIGTGLSMPAMMILFGDLTNGFVGQGLTPEQLNEIRCNFSFYYNLTNGSIADL